MSNALFIVLVTSPTSYLKKKDFHKHLFYLHLLSFISSLLEIKRILLLEEFLPYKENQEKLLSLVNNLSPEIYFRWGN